MPINVNSQLITAISCEGREIVRAHAGLDLVWAKADPVPVPDGFVNIGGTIWSTKGLDWTDGGADIRTFVPFGNSEVYYYYDRSAVVRYLSANPDYRLPSYDDCLALMSYLRENGYAGFRSLAIPSLTYWYTVHPEMVDAFGFGAKGYGFFSSGAWRAYRDAMWFRITGAYNVAAFGVGQGVGLNYLNFDFTSYLHVRLIYDPL